MEDASTYSGPFKVDKLRLNDTQWTQLQSLAKDTPRQAIGDPIARAGRLTSNGLVATDRSGREYLTILGMLRLSQGR